MEEITPERLPPQDVVDPAPDILYRGEQNRSASSGDARVFENTETMLEVLDTPNAIATYNILCKRGGK